LIEQGAHGNLKHNFVSLTLMGQICH